MTGVDEIFAGQRRRRNQTCPLCDKRRAFQIAVQIRQLNEQGQTGDKGSRSKSVAVGFCDEHAAELFTLLTGELSKATS